MTTSNYDVDFDFQAASNWKIEVEDELDQVKALLNQVSEDCTAIPGEKDTIMNGIEEIGEHMHDAWNTLFDGFAQILDIFGNIITEREKSVSKVTDQFQDYKNNFHN